MSAEVQTAIALIRAGDHVAGSRLLRAALRADPADEQAWLWMSAVVATDDERRQCLQRVLALNSQNAAALRGLALLDGTPAPSTSSASSPSAPPSAAAEALPTPPPPSEPPPPPPVATSRPAPKLTPAPLSVAPAAPEAPAAPTPAPVTTPALPPLSVLAVRLLAKPLAAVALSVGFTLLSYFAALDAAVGSRPEIHGRYQLYKQLYAWLIITLGPTGVLVVGGLACLLAALWLGLRVRTLARLHAVARVPRPSAAPRPREAPRRPFRAALIATLVLLIVGAGAVEVLLLRRAAAVAYEPVVMPFPTLAIPTAVGGGPLIIDGQYIADYGNQGLETLSLDELRDRPISILNLSGNPLRAIPPEIADLDQIQYLFMTEVGLTRLPLEITDMESLRGLVLTDNALTELPPEIGRLRHLERLDIAGNRITRLPAELTQLSDLSELDLRGNPLGAEDIPPALRERPGLTIRFDPQPVAQPAAPPSTATAPAQATAPPSATVAATQTAAMPTPSATVAATQTAAMPTPSATVAATQPTSAGVASADDTRPIAYVAGDEGTQHIFRVNTDGSKPLRITRATRANSHPDWSPDGRRIAFSGREEGAWDIYVMDADGSNLKRLTTSPDDEMFPVWSPEGRRIAYLAPGEKGMHLHLMDADGSHVVDTGVVTYDLFDWSPDGTRIVFSAGYDLFVMHTGSFEVELLLRTPFDDMEPSWSPDGQYIAFVSGEASVSNDGTQDIYLVRPDGSDLTNVTRSPANDRMPEWSPDGSQLVFLAMSPLRGFAQTGYWDIAIINRDGTGFTRLTAAEQDYDKPVWRP